MFEDDLKLEDIELKSVSKSFEFEKLSREIESCNDIETLRRLTKLSIKLMFKQQETLTLIGNVL